MNEKTRKIKGMKKKGQVQYFLESAFRIGFLMIALLAFFLLINFYISNRIDTSRLQSEVLANRIIYSDAIMWQEKENSRVYTGIVDMDQFSSTTLDMKINYTTKRHATAKLQIIDNIDGKVNSTIYLNKLQYDNLEAIAGKQGKGAATIYVKNYPITYRKGSESRYGTLVMNIIIPNS